MAIPSRQIGQPSSTKAQLLWNISKQLENLIKVAGNVVITPPTPPVSPTWTFNSGVDLSFPTNQDGYTLYQGGFTNYDDGDAIEPVLYAGTFNSYGQSDTQFILSTNGYLTGTNTNFRINGNQQDLFLTPGDSLLDGDTQNFWYQNTSDANKWKTSVLVYCGHCCGSPQQNVPYSYILNIYQDAQYQYIETRVKSYNGGQAGPNGFTQNSETTSQVWQSPLDGSGWTYLGFGSVQ